ncbi:flagellar biosynthesis protein FlhF [uncultured Gammaproteobacteria bacterium]
MRLKSFHAKTMAEAMRQVRAALGDDAIIVASREEEGGGVRVTAAIEEDEQPAAKGRSRQSGATAAAKEPEPVVDIGEAVANALHRHGTPATIAEKVIDIVSDLDIDDPVMALGAGLDAVFSFQPLSDGGSGKPLLLVGPPGSGKTLTVAKLATRAVFKKRPVSVITTDTVRAGGVEQLAGFMRLLKIKLVCVEDAAALADALEVQAETEQLLIDTAGSNPYDSGDMTDLRRLVAAGGVEPVLVLPAGLDAQEAADIGQIFRSAGVRRLVITRLDTVRRFGSTLAAVYESRLNFSDVGVSARVADGLTPLTPIALARLMMPGEDRTGRARRGTARATTGTAPAPVASPPARPSKRTGMREMA